MDERELREKFRREFEDERPAPGAYQAAVHNAFEREGSRLPRWAVPAAALLAVAMVATLALTHRAPRTQISTLSAAAPGVAPGKVTADALPAAAASPAEPPTVHVAALNSQVALASAGDAIERTTDGGQHWTVLFPGADGHKGTVRDLEWVTGTVAFAATSYGLLRMDTDPVSWSRVGDRTDLQRLDLLSPLLGYAVAGDRLVKTEDGGKNFAEVDVGLGSVSWIQWVSPTRGWAAGPRGIVTTSDAGRSWNLQFAFNDAPSTTAGTTQVGIRDDLTGFAYHRAGGGSVLLHTTDGGQSWTPAPRLPAGVTSDLVVTGPQAVELLQATGDARSQLCSTADAGGSWHCSDLPVGGAPGQLSIKGHTRWLALQDSGAVFAVSRDSQTWAAHRRPLETAP